MPSFGVIDAVFGWVYVRLPDLVHSSLFGGPPYGVGDGESGEETSFYKGDLVELRRLFIGADPVLGVGVDIEAVSRFREPTLGLFSDAEIRDCLASQHPADAFAGRWCAKEAVVKALSGRVSLRITDIEIVTDSTGAPRAWVTWHPVGGTSALQTKDSPTGDKGRELLEGVAVSISHAAGIAVAVAVDCSRSCATGRLL